MAGSKVRFTEKQMSAIMAQGSDVLVSAAAGSGKTAVLTERVMRLIQEGTPVENMLIVTFTNAAAAQMRRRIADRLEAAGMAEVAKSVTSANISTIHSFCTAVLREFFVEAAVDPMFKVMEESRSFRMREAAFEVALEKMLEDERFYDTIEVFSGLGGVKGIITRLYNFSRSRPDPDAWVDGMAKAYRKNAEDIDSSEWAKDVLAIARREVKKACEVIDEAFGIVDDEKGQAVLLSDAEVITNVMAAIDMGYSAFSAYKFSYSNWSTSKEYKKENPEEAEAGKILHNKAREILKDAMKVPALITARENDREMAVHLERLCAMLKEYAWAYFDMKAESAELDFSDLEHFALQALQNDEVSAQLRRRFEYVFIDEYQDANALQEEILKRVTRGDNLFMVGDIKQSIYGFRMAEPSLFAGKYERFAAGDGGRRITMNDNFRSGRGVIDCVNRVFSKIMTRDFGGVDYDDDAKLLPGRRESDDDALPAELQLLAVPEVKSELEESDDAADFLQNFSAKRAECQLIVENIIALLGKEMKIGGVYRPVELKDIAVLMRSPSSWIAPLTELMRSVNISFVTDNSQGYYNLSEIKAVVNLLSVIDNRHQDLPLIGALLAPYTAFTTEEMAHIRTAYSGRGVPFHVACMSYAKEIDDSIAKRLNEFFDSLRRWRELNRRVTVSSLVQTVFDETGYYDFVGALPYGSVRQENLRQFIRRAANYDTLSELVSVVSLGNDKAGDGDTFSAAPENEQAVTIMSVHKSKGLEFPVVILAGTGTEFNRRDMWNLLIFHREKGFGVRYTDSELLIRQKTLSQMSVEEAMTRDLLAEELRVLYVAMTRAQEKLIITGSVKKVEKAEDKWQRMADNRDFSEADCHLDFLAPWFDGEKYVSIAPEKMDGDISEVGQDFSVKQFDWIKERLDWAYQGESAKRPEKMNVTALSRGEEKSIPPRPEFVQERFGLSSAERGTAMHTVMSALNKKALVGLGKADAQAEISVQSAGMLQRGLISRVQLGAVPVESIAAFFVSDLGRRALASNELLCEQPFNIVVSPEEAGIEEPAEDKLLLQGIIDMCFVENGRWVIVDFKSGRISAQKARDVYGQQVKLYALAMRRLSGVDAAAYLYLLDSGATVELL